MSLAGSVTGEIKALGSTLLYFTIFMRLWRGSVDNIKNNRAFMKSALDDTDIVATADIAQGVPQPPLEKPYPSDAYTIALPEVNHTTAPQVDLFACMARRCSRRAYTGEALSLPELAFLLWATQGIKQIIPGYKKYMKDGLNTLRPVPSGGAIHPYETYLAINHVAGIDPGVWRYLPLSHQLLQVRPVQNLDKELPAIFSNPSQNQHYVSQAAVVFFWVCTPYKGEWRYQHTAHKIMLLDVGHICQNLYLAVEAIGGGCCAIGAYYQAKADSFVGVNGTDEYTVYCAAVGRIQGTTTSQANPIKPEHKE
jgi:SagB-type dehydrogenase family enzyme